MTDQQTYGYEEDFQKAIVAAALQDPTLLMQYRDILQPSYLDYDYLSSILRTARELTERIGEVPTKMSVVEEMKEFCIRLNISSGDREFILGKLEEIYSIPTNDLEYIQSRIVDFGKRQSLRGAVLKIVSMFQRPPKKGEDVHEKAVMILEQALQAGLDTQSLGLSLYPNLEKLPEMASASIAGISKKVPTGFETLDKNTLGGPGRGEIWTVVGLPGRGKSAFLVNIGVAALKNGFPVLHFTIGDLEQVDVGVRYAARLTMCSTYEVITGSAAYRRKAAKLARYNPHLHIKYFPPDTVTMAHLRAHVTRLRAIEEVSPAVVIVDYPEELKMAVKGDLYLSGGSNYSSMKAMASEFDALFWAASQPQRWKPEHEKDVIKGINMGESWKKFQKVDGMVSWNMTNEEEMYGRGRLWVDKTRRAKSFYLINCDVDLEMMLIKEGKEPDDLEEAA